MPRSPDIRSEVARLLRQKPDLGFDSFPRTLNLYEPLRGGIAYGDVTSLPIPRAQQMPDNSVTEFFVDTPGKIYLIQFARAESILYLESIKFVPAEAQDYKLEANVYRKPLLLDMFHDSPFIQELSRPDAVIMKYDLIATVNGVHFTPLRAKRFLPWALQVLDAKHHITHVMAEWEPDGLNHKQFYQALSQNGGLVDDAATKTWTHMQYSQMGLRRLSGTYFTPCLNGKTSPYGNNVVYSLYTR